MALQNSQAIGRKCQKPLENHGFAAEKLATELFAFFLGFFQPDGKISLLTTSVDKASHKPLRITLGIVTEKGAGVDRVSKVLAKPLVLLSNCFDCSGDRN